MLTTAQLPDLLDDQRERSLARRIEAGLVAAHALAHPWRTDASPAELRRIRDEGAAAWQEFLAANLRLAAMLARNAARRTGVEFDELLQEAALALARALLRFDPDRGRFSTYAFPAISRQLVRVTSSLAGQLGLPRSRAVTLRRVQRLTQELTQELARTPDLAEISEVVGRDAGWTGDLLQYRAPLSLDELSQLPPDPDSAHDGRDESLAHQQLREEVERLPIDQCEVLKLRFGFVDGHCHSYRETAAVLEFSSSSIRRIEQRGLAELRRRRPTASVPAAEAG